MLLIQWAINVAATLWLQGLAWCGLSLGWMQVANNGGGGKCQQAVKESSHRGQVPTVGGEALHDKTRSEVTSCVGNDNLTRCHVCNYHPWLSLSVAWAGFLSRPSAGIFMWHTSPWGEVLLEGTEGKPRSRYFVNPLTCFTTGRINRIEVDKMFIKSCTLCPKPIKINE